jgi:hypothetical protein
MADACGVDNERRRTDILSAVVVSSARDGCGCGGGNSSGGGGDFGDCICGGGSDARRNYCCL